MSQNDIQRLENVPVGVTHPSCRVVGRRPWQRYYVACCPVSSAVWPNTKPQHPAVDVVGRPLLQINPTLKNNTSLFVILFKQKLSASLVIFRGLVVCVHLHCPLPFHFHFFQVLLVFGVTSGTCWPGSGPVRGNDPGRSDHCTTILDLCAYWEGQRELAAPVQSKASLYIHVSVLLLVQLLCG